MSTSQSRPRGNGLRCSWFNRQPPSHRKFLLGLVVLLFTQASHATSFTVNSHACIQKHASLSTRGGSGRGSGGKLGVAADASALLDFDQRDTNVFLRPSLASPSSGSNDTMVLLQPPPATAAAIQDNKKEETAKVPLSKIDIGTFGVHFCAAVTMTLPVMIVPMMDAELLATGAAASTAALTRGASLAATMASMAPMGNGIGKLVNGVVCQQLGGPKSSKFYFVGSILASLAVASLSLSATGGLLTTDNLGWMVGSIEFFASIQWTVCSLFLSQYYRNKPELFARGITVLALSSTGGQIIGKLMGAFLLQFLHWRHVARLSVLTAVSGLCISVWTSRNMAKAMKVSAPTTTTTSGTVQKQMSHKQEKDNAEGATVSAKQAVRKVLGSPVFWCIGLAHVSGYLTRTSDRILGSFLQEITSLSPQVCGGLTAFMTVGFLYGLVTTSKKFHQQSATAPKLRLLRNGYKRYLLSAAGLVASAAFGKQWHPHVSATIITVCASIMASSIAFPFFQVPNMVSSIYFGEVKPVALSLIDGTGVVMTAPIWMFFNRVLLPKFGWTTSWSAVALIVGVCGTLLMKTMPDVLELQKQQQANSSEGSTP